MRQVLWGVFFVISNMVGVEVFKAAVTLPRDEALLPVVLTIPMVALAALAATRVMAAWKDGEKR